MILNEFENHYTSYLWGMVADASDQLLLYGEHYSNSAQRYGLLVKTDESGNILWSKDFYGQNGVTTIDDVILSPSGNFISLNGSGQNQSSRLIEWDQNGDTIRSGNYFFTNTSPGFHLYNKGSNGYAVSTGEWQFSDSDTTSNIFLFSVDSTLYNPCSTYKTVVPISTPPILINSLSVSTQNIAYSIFPSNPLIITPFFQATTPALKTV